MQITLHHYLVLSALLFSLGLAGLMIRRNLLVMFMCLEVLLNAVNLAFVAVARHRGLMDGQITAVIVMALAAVEAAIGLGVLIALFRNRQTVDSSELTILQG